jgi:A/G-specific adenine glycosylase
MHRKNNNLSKKILIWYDNSRRILPWRLELGVQKKQYYRILSEFMLQQTQVKTVIPYFKNFVEKIPNLENLSMSNGKKILKLWEGLGYYRRVKNLHMTAKIIIKKYNGTLPKELDEIKKLPGVGEYTANALLALVYNKAYIPFDGNVKRIFLRLFKIKIEKNEEKIKKIINENFVTKRNGDLAEALMEFGALVCKPINPLCIKCSLKNNCHFFKNNDLLLVNNKKVEKKKKYNIYCYLKKEKKEIALKNNKKLGFLNNFKIPETKLEKIKNNKNNKKNGWIYFCSYKNNISNVKMDINLFYKFIKFKPSSYNWYFIDKQNKEFIPTFTKKIFKHISKVYT